MKRLGVAEAIVDGVRHAGDVGIVDGLVAEVGVSPAGSGIAIPGLVDLQVNGFGGVDLLSADEEEWATVGRRLLGVGVTAYLPTLITSPQAVVEAALAAAARTQRAESVGARILGVHLEGPFISPQRLGVHPGEHRRDPDPGLLEALLASGPVQMVTLAPELPGAIELVELLRRRGILVSLGHSAAPGAVAHTAFDHGAGAVTHVFNAMEPILAREPGIAGVALSRDDVAVLCIVDGVHLAAENVRLIFGRERGTSVLTSDAIAAAGSGDGEYRLGAETIAVSAGRATRADGTLAGSVGTTAAALPLLVELGIPLERAVVAASAAPARLLGRPQLGRLRRGAVADVVLLDDALEITAVLLAGELVEQELGL